MSKLLKYLFGCKLNTVYKSIRDYTYKSPTLLKLYSIACSNNVYIGGILTLNFSNCVYIDTTREPTPDSLVRLAHDLSHVITNLKGVSSEIYAYNNQGLVRQELQQAGYTVTITEPSVDEIQELYGPYYGEYKETVDA